MTGYQCEAPAEFCSSFLGANPSLIVGSKVMFNNINKFPLWSLKLAVKLTGRPTGVSERLKNDISDLGCIFIHIPKCAGNAVQKSLFGEVVFGHQTVRQYQLALGSSEYRKAWKFAITRDPWERIVSAWRFLKAGGLHAHDEKYYSENLGEFQTFDHFVNDWLVNQDLSRCGCVHFKPQVHYIKGFDGHVAIDYILKLSDLQTEYEKLREKFNGVALIENNLAQGGKVDFRSFITSNETYKNLAKVYAEDIRLLGY